MQLISLNQEGKEFLAGVRAELLVPRLKILHVYPSRRLFNLMKMKKCITCERVTKRKQSQREGTEVVFYPLYVY